MTVITMPSSEKKSDNVPLVTDIEVDPATVQVKDLEAGNLKSDRPVRSKFLVLRVINDRVYSMWALVYVLLMSLLVIFMMLYGEHIYRAIGNAFNDESDAFYGTGTISLNDKLTRDMDNSYDNMDQLNDKVFRKFENMLMDNEPTMMTPGDVSEFKEDFEIDLLDDSYEKIAPIIPRENSARFIHDFSANVTGIVDVEGKRCFVMPLNRSSVLPPKSLYDLLFKMSSGYYAVDTENLMHNMRVITPPLQDISEYGIYIAKDCAGLPTYKLEKIVSGVYKRSVPTGASKVFSVFSGRMDSFHIVNYDQINDINSQ